MNEIRRGAIPPFRVGGSINKLNWVLMVGIVTTLGLFAGEAEEAAAKSKTLDPRRVSVAVQIMAKTHFRERSVNPALMTRIFAQAAGHMDPNKMVMTKAEAESVGRSKVEFSQDACDKVLDGDFSAFYSAVDEFQALAGRDKDFYDKLESMSDDIKKASKEKFAPSKEWCATTEQRHDRIIRWVGVMYQVYASYLTEADAMAMAIKNAKLYNERAFKDKSENDRLSLFMKSFANALDPHTNYFDPDDSIAKHLERHFVGIGVMFKPTPLGCLIENVIENGPADKSKAIHKGDQIVAVNGESLAGMSSDEMGQRVKGEAGTEIVIDVLKGDTKKTEKVKMLRGVVDNGNRIKRKMVTTPQGTVAVLSIEGFYEGMTVDVAEHMADIAKTTKIVGLVIDLRNNGGGYLDEAIHLLAMFIPEGPLVSTWDGRVPSPKWALTKKHAVLYDGPLVVLVNQGSASASELTAGSLLDYNRAVIVGPTRTFGKGSVQSSNMVLKMLLPGDVTYTTNLYFLPRGGSVQARGVEPDVKILGNKLIEEDTETGLYENTIPWMRIEGALNKDDVNAGKWGKWHDANIIGLNDRSAARVAKNKEYKDRYAKPEPEDKKNAEPKKDEVDFQAEEAADVAGDMSETWGK